MPARLPARLVPARQAAAWLAAVPLALLAAVPAVAAPISDVFTVRASGFVDVLGSATAPADPVTLRVALTFDPASGDQFDSASGLTLLAASVPVGGGLAFDYDSANDVLTFGGAGLGGIGITAGTADLLAVVDTPYTGTATFGGLAYTTAAAGGSVFESFTGSVAVAPTAVPEPGAVAVLLAGLAGLGLARRRRG